MTQTKVRNEILSKVQFVFNKTKRTIVIFCDISVDTDDLAAILMIACKQGYNVVIVCCGKDPLKKARYAQGVVDTLSQRGLDVSHIQILAGTDCNVKEETLEHQFAPLPFEMSEESDINTNWEEFLYEVLLNSSAKSVMVLGIGPMTDLCKFMFQNSALVKQKVNSLSLMCDVDVSSGQINDDWGLPMYGGANNGTFDAKATPALYAKMFEEEFFIKTIILSNIATSQCKIGYQFYNDLVKQSDNHPIAEVFTAKQQAGLKHLWQRCASSEATSLRGSLPLDRNSHWFNTVFCSGLIPEKEYGNLDFDPIGYLIETRQEAVVKFQLYDAMALLALLLSIENHDKYLEFFNPVKVNNLDIIGFDKDNNGVLNPKSILEEIFSLMLQSLQGCKMP